MKVEISFDAVFSSPIVRAQQTAEVLSDEMKAKPKVQLTEHLAPGGSARELVNLLQQLSDLPQEIQLVGHEPDLGQLASLLLSESDDVTLVFKKGGIAKLAIESLRAGRCATLEWLMTSRQLETMT